MPPLTLNGYGHPKQMSTKQELTEDPIAVVHEVLQGWLEENEAADFDENDVAHLFAMLGTAGYSIVPNIDEAKLAKLNEDVMHNLANGPLYIEAGVRWVQRTRVLSVLEQLTQAGAEVLARLRASETKVRELTEQLTPGSPTERAPTQWAYEQACAAIEKHRLRADIAEARLREISEAAANFPEINPGNYNDEDACALNNWGIEMCGVIDKLPTS